MISQKLAAILVLTLSTTTMALAKLPIPPEVWAKYDPDAGDFKEEIVSEESKNGIYRRDSYISAYVNGEEIRVFCKYAVKADAKNAPGLMSVHGWMSMAGINEPYVKEGWAVMAHDYCGEVAGRPQFTKYPAPMKYGNMDKRITPRVKDKLPDGKDITDPSQTDDYLWYAIQRRVLSYLLAQKEVDKSRIGGIGYSYGGSLMWNLAMDSRVKAVVAYFGIGWLDYYRNKSVWLYNVPPKNPPKTPGEELLLSAIVPEAHARHIKAACLWLSGTNDHHGGHERSETTFQMFQPGVPWSYALQARGRHDTDKLGNDAKLWLEKYVLGKDIDWPARPKTAIRLDAQGVPEFVLTPQSLDNLEKVEGYYALKDPCSFSRFWRDAKLERQGDIWVAKLPVANVDDYVFAFANLRYKGDIVISSDFTAAIPSKLGQAVATDTRAENLIDGEGLWSNVKKVEGPGGIKGIQATHNEWGFSSVCMNDPKWKAPKGSDLSFQFLSPEPQAVVFEVDKNFKTQIDLPASTEWQSMTIPASKLLRGGNGDPLGDWSGVTSLIIKAAPEKNLTKVIFADIEWTTPATKSRFVQNLEAGRKQTLVTYGTSLTAIGAWVDQLSAVLDQQFPGLATVVNGAQGGASSVWGREKLDEKVLAHKPDTVLIEFSVNDAVQKLKISPAQARKNLENLIDRILQANPDGEIILQVMNPPVGHTKTDRPNLAAYDQIYRDVAKERGLRLIDHGPAWIELMKKDPALFMRCIPDTIHPVRNGALEVSTPVVLAGLGLAPGNPAASTDDPCWKYMRILMDADKDRTVTRAEFDTFWAGHFTKSDANGDGNLDAGEFHYEELARGLDANRDGKLDRDEFVAPISPLFETDSKNPFSP